MGCRRRTTSQAAMGYAAIWPPAKRNTFLFFARDKFLPVSIPLIEFFCLFPVQLWMPFVARTQTQSPQLINTSKIKCFTIYSCRSRSLSSQFSLYSDYFFPFALHFIFVVRPGPVFHSRLSSLEMFVLIQRRWPVPICCFNYASQRFARLSDSILINSRSLCATIHLSSVGSLVSAIGLDRSFFRVHSVVIGIMSNEENSKRMRELAKTHGK